jgi:monoamine oxidase
VTAIEHGQSGVKVTCRENGHATVHEADHVVCAMSAVMLRNLPVTPAFPESKALAIANVPYYFATRPIFQTRSRFWTRENLTASMEFNVPELNSVWTASEEVQTPRGLIVGTATGPQTPERALAAYRRLYPGKLQDVEKAHAVVWATDPWASACETTEYAPGELSRFWPALIESHGRVHFCGAYADNLNWGQEAATRSAFRVAETIDKI